jgi:flagella basal body P-ring formation protein FlgA
LCLWPHDLEAQTRVELLSGKVTAGDLAGPIPVFSQVEKSSSLAHAPLPGVERSVSRAELARWARSLGLSVEPETLPESVVLSRKLRRFPAAEAERLIVHLVAGHYGIDEAQVGVELLDFREPLVPAGETEFALTAPPSRIGRPSTLTIGWTGSGGGAGRFALRAAVAVRGTYAVARESLAAWSEISPADFDFLDGALPGPPADYLLSPQQVEGVELKRSLRAGEPLRRTVLRPTVTVRRGDLIELRFRSRSIVLRTPARAEESGAAGRTIRCRNLQSGNTVSARITGPREAEAQPLP